MDEKKIDSDVTDLEEIDFTQLEQAAVEAIEEKAPEERPPAPEETQPMISVTSDGLTAYYVPPSGKGRSVTREEIDDLLTRAGVVYGIDVDAISRVLAGVSSDIPFPVAHGEPAVHGRDAEVTLTLDLTAKPGEMLEDGSIDFRERSAVVAVKAGQLLATKVRATAGRPGRDVYGRAIPAEGGKDRALTAGRSVHVEASEEGWRFYAEVDGSVMLKGDTLHVFTVHRVSGNVDFYTGNIDFGGDVMVTGSVGTGFSVKVGGTISIGQSVERNTTLTVGEDVWVGQGIAGQGITVVSGGSVIAKYIQDAAVVAKQDVIVGSYIFNASIRAGGRVVCYGRGLSRQRQRSTGMISGGVIFAAKGIETHSLGSDYAKSTQVVVGIDHETIEHLDKIQKGITFCETSLMKVIRTLGIGHLSPEGIKQLLTRIPEARRETIITLLREASKLKKTQETLLVERKKVEERMEESVRGVIVQVHQAVFQGVEIRIGRASLRVPRTLQNVRFSIDPETGTITWTTPREEKTL
jgi:uncharacterized protein (DUF342 family)